MAEERIAKLSNVPSYYKKVYLELMEAVDLHLKNHDLVTWIRELEDDGDHEEALEVSFRSKDDKVFSPITLLFEGPSVTGDKQASWSKAGLECDSFSTENIGDNGWVMTTDNGVHQNVEFRTFYEGKGDNDIITDLVGRMNTLGVYVDDGGRHGHVTESFGSVYDDLHSSVLDIEDTDGNITVSRNSRGTEAYSFVDAQDRRIAIALPRGAEEWSCYVNERLVGRGDWSELFGDYVRTESKETIREDRMAY